jgi:DNA-binding TFAR19-related protein (PDSD5 family)
MQSSSGSDEKGAQDLQFQQQVYVITNQILTALKQWRGIQGSTGASNQHESENKQRQRMAEQQEIMKNSILTQVLLTLSLHCNIKLLFLIDFGQICLGTIEQFECGQTGQGESSGEPNCPNGQVILSSKLGAFVSLGNFFRSGQIRGKMSDDDLRNLLDRMAGTTKTTKVKVGTIYLMNKKNFLPKIFFH